MCKTCQTPRLPNLLPMQALELATNIMPQGSTTISIPTDNENRRRRNANRRRRSANWRQWEVTWQILGLDAVMQAALLSAFLSGIEDRINCRIWPFAQGGSIPTSILKSREGCGYDCYCWTKKEIEH